MSATFGNSHHPIGSFANANLGPDALIEQYQCAIPFARIGGRLGPTEPADTFDLIAVVQIRQFTIDIELRFAGCGNPSPSLFDGGYFENSRRGVFARSRDQRVVFCVIDAHRFFVESSANMNEKRFFCGPVTDVIVGKTISPVVMIDCPNAGTSSPKIEYGAGRSAPGEVNYEDGKTDNRGDRTEKKRNGKVAIGNDSRGKRRRCRHQRRISQRREKEGQVGHAWLGVNAK